MRLRITSLIAVALLGLIHGMASPQRRSKTEGLVTLPAWIVAGKPANIQVFGPDLAPKSLTFDDARLSGRMVKVGPFTAKTDEEKQRGNSVVEFEVSAPANVRPGYYKFKLIGDEGEPATGRVYVDLPAPEIQEQEPNDALAKPQALPPGAVTVLGTLGGDGVDVFQVIGKAGQTWRFEVFARRLNPQAKLEPVLRLRNARLTSLRVAVDQGEDCFIEYKLLADGAYLLELFDGDNKTEPGLNYRLAVRCLEGLL